MNPEEMEKSMLNIAAAAEPTLAQKKKAGRFGYDPIRGEKVRLDRPKKEETVKERK